MKSFRMLIKKIGYDIKDYFYWEYSKDRKNYRILSTYKSMCDKTFSDIFKHYKIYLRGEYSIHSICMALSTFVSKADRTTLHELTTNYKVTDIREKMCLESIKIMCSLADCPTQERAKKLEDTLHKHFQEYKDRQNRHLDQKFESNK